MYKLYFLFMINNSYCDTGLCKQIQFTNKNEKDKVK